MSNACMIRHLSTVAQRVLCFSGLRAVVLASTLVSVPSFASLGDNLPVGQIFDETIFRVELRGDPAVGSSVADLRARIVVPVLAKYRETYGRFFEPFDYELNAAMTHLQDMHQRRLSDKAMELSARLALIETQLTQTDLSDQELHALNQQHDEVLAELEPPSFDRVRTLVSYWKFQRHLYDAYGGGRVVMQSYGPEAVDATLQWLHLREAEGDFSIEDNQLRDAFYALWTDCDGADALLSTTSSDLERQDEQNRYRLLNPAWVRAWYEDITRESWSDSVTLNADLFGVQMGE